MEYIICAILSTSTVEIYQLIYFNKYMKIIYEYIIIDTFFFCLVFGENDIHPLYHYLDV